MGTNKHGRMRGIGMGAVNGGGVERKYMWHAKELGRNNKDEEI